MAAVRDRLIVSLMLLTIVGACLSIFLGSAAMIEYDQFAVVFTAGGLRFAGALGLILFAVFFIRRSFDNKDVEYLLSRPLSRTSFLLSHAVAFSMIAVLLALVIGLAVVAVRPFGMGMGHVLWVVSLMAEFVIVINAALFFSMVLTSAASSALAVMGLYVLARLMGQLLGIAGVAMSVPGLPVLQYAMQIVSMVTPRLDLMAQTTWLVYPDQIGNVNLTFIIFQGIFYTMLLLAASLVDLNRRQF